MPTDVSAESAPEQETSPTAAPTVVELHGHPQVLRRQVEVLKGVDLTVHAASTS